MSSEAGVLESILKFGEVDHLSKYLDYCAENGLFSCENEDALGAISTANRLLNEASTRRDGLLVLKCLLGQLPSKLLQNNIFSWVQQSVKGLSQKDSSTTVCVAADVTGILLGLSPKFAECRKQIAINSINKIFEVLFELKDVPDFQKIVLSTLCIVLEHYSKSAHSWKDKFENFLISVIEREEETVFFAARCFLALGASGLPGAENVNYKDNWMILFKSLSSSLHSILDRLFENVNEIEQFSRGRVKTKPNFALPTVNDKIPFMKMSRLTAQFTGLSRFLEVMLLGRYPVRKKVTPELVLSVVCRGLAISSQTLQSQVTSDSASLMTQLPQLHLCCLSILNGLIRSCRKNLIPCGPVICKLLSQVLKSTETKTAIHGQHKPLSSVRQSAYKCLTSWLTITSCSSGVEKYPELVDSLIADVQYKKPVITLNMSSKILRGKLGKRQRQTLVNQTVENREEYVTDREANNGVCSAALEVVPILLESASTLLQPQAHKALGEAVCSELLVTQLNSFENAPLPYSNKECRLGLYKCFVALCHTFHPEFPPPLSFATQILTGGLQDTSSEVVRFCATAMSTLDKMLRPIGPTLAFPLELPELLAPPKTASSFIHLPYSHEQSKSAESVPRRQPPVDGPEDRKVNGTELDHSPSIAELEVIPLLIDPEMSDFDYSHSEKERLDRNLCLVEDKTQNLAVDQCPAQGKEDYGTSGSLTPERVTTPEAKERIPLENGVSFKRKPTEKEGFLASKKSKSEKCSDGQTSLPNIPDTMQTDEVIGSSQPVITGDDGEVQKPIGKSSPPRNVLEEEMLSSFIDEVV